MSVLAPVPDFDAEDGFLHALLGVIAADAALRELVSSAPPPAPEAACRAARDGAGDPVLDAVLGLIRLTSLASRVTSSWADAARGAARSEVSTTLSPIEGLLR